MGGSGDAHRLTVHRRSQLGCAASPAGVYEHLCLLPSDLQQLDALMIVYVIELWVLVATAHVRPPSRCPDHRAHNRLSIRSAERLSPPRDALEEVRTQSKGLVTSTHPSYSADQTRVAATCGRVLDHLRSMQSNCQLQDMSSNGCAGQERVLVTVAHIRH